MIFSVKLQKVFSIQKKNILLRDFFGGLTRSHEFECKYKGKSCAKHHPDYKLARAR
jgi:hypothetical protein